MNRLAVRDGHTSVASSGEELGKISLVDVVLPTRDGPEIRRRCVRRPTEHQAILFDRFVADPAPADQELKTKCSEDV